MTHVPRLLAFCALVTVANIACSSPFKDSTLVLTDPSNAFEVHLAGDFSAPLYGKSIVRATVLRAAGSKIGPFPIYEAGFSGFGLQTPVPHSRVAIARHPKIDQHRSLKA